jgi:hypothetical protein
MDVSPKTHFLESIRCDRGSYTSLLAEAIDNSFDAGASRIDIEMAADKISVRDNGEGIAKKAEDAIVTFGEHVDLAATKLGKFGIGIKYQAISAADQMDVISTSSDGRMMLRVDWQKLIDGLIWTVPDPKWDKSITNPTGAKITLHKFRWKKPTTADIVKAITDLSQIFQPALVSGRVIAINDEGLPQLNDPDLSSVVDGEIEIDGQIVATVHGGVLVDHKAALYQVHVAYQHRVVMPRSSFGCGDAGGGLRQLFARVQLHGQWKLSRFKDDIYHDPRCEQLADKVELILRPILDQCRDATMDVTIRDMEMRLNDRLPKTLRPARPDKKKPRGKPGKKKGKPHGVTDTGRENDNGPARKPAHPRGIKIAFEDNLSEECGFGRFERTGNNAKTGRIVLSKDNPYIKKLLENRDKKIATESLYQIAIGLYLHEKDNAPEMHGQTHFQADGFAPFGKQWCKLFSSQVIADA